jgi:hypothetical protein
MDLKGAADSQPGPRSTKRRSSLWIILPAIPLALWFASSIHWTSGCAPSYEAMAHHLISQVSTAVKAYELDHEQYPAGDGKGSGPLVRSLQTSMSKKRTYLDVRPEMVDEGGNLRNPVGEGKILHYRFPGQHNPKSFDLWCEDRKGRADGINNWEK